MIEKINLLKWQLKYRLLEEKTNQYSLPKRVLLFTGAISLVFTLWYIAILFPLKANSLRLSTSNTIETTTVNQLRASEIELTSKTKEAEKKYVAVQQNMQEMAKTLAQFSQKLAPATTILGFVWDIINKNKQISLIDLQTLSPQILLDSPPDQFIEEPVEITFKGNYFSTLDFLKVLEALPYPFRWQEIDYQVTTYPAAKIKLKFSSINNVTKRTK